MEGERKKKKPIELDWDRLLPPGEDDLPPEVMVTTSTEAAEQPQSQSAIDGENTPQRDDFHRLTDAKLNEAIDRYRQNLESLGPRLPDRGAKLRATLKRHEHERQRRRFRRLEKDDDGCENLTQLQNSRLIGASDGLRQCTASSLPFSQSSFASRFCRKLEEDTDCRTVDAFEKELSYLSRNERWKPRSSRQFSPRGRHKSGLNSKKRPFQSPISFSADVDTQICSNGEQKGAHSSTSPHHFEGNMSSCFSKTKNASQVQHPNGLRRRNTVVLVEEEEPQVIEMIQPADKVDKCVKETKIYYPSSDDPESIEICYSDMECLAPQAYLSSTIMNFYIRYLQQPMHPTDKAIHDYHFFNTYFYKKLKEAVLNKSERETLFVKFRRWWKGVNIFEKAYILLPIHENLHWSLVIICIPDKEDESGPILLHLDSLGIHSSRPIFDNIKSFLKEEWKYLNQGEAPPHLPITDKIWKNLPRRIDEKIIPVPQQKNDYDCGLFVLFFMERFIEEAPERLKKKDLAMFGKQWFQPEEASSLRRKIRDLLTTEFKNASEDKCVLSPLPSRRLVVVADVDH